MAENNIKKQNATTQETKKQQINESSPSIQSATDTKGEKNNSSKKKESKKVIIKLLPDQPFFHFKNILLEQNKKTRVEFREDDPVIIDIIDMVKRGIFPNGIEIEGLDIYKIYRDNIDTKFGSVDLSKVDKFIIKLSDRIYYRRFGEDDDPIELDRSKGIISAEVKSNYKYLPQIIYALKVGTIKIADKEEKASPEVEEPISYDKDLARRREVFQDIINIASQRKLAPEAVETFLKTEFKDIVEEFKFTILEILEGIRSRIDNLIDNNIKTEQNKLYRELADKYTEFIRSKYSN